MPEQGEFCNNCCKNQACKRGRLVNAANDFKDQRRSSNRPATVMFRGTPCIYFGFRCWECIELILVTINFNLLKCNSIFLDISIFNIVSLSIYLSLSIYNIHNIIYCSIYLSLSIFNIHNIIYSFIYIYIFLSWLMIFKISYFSLTIFLSRYMIFTILSIYLSIFLSWYMIFTIIIYLSIYIAI